MTPRDQRQSDLASIHRLIRRFSARLRLQRAILGAVEGACLGLMFAAVGIAASRTGYLETDTWWIWALLTIGLTVGGALVRALPTIDPITAAQAIDRANGLHDRLSTAISLAISDRQHSDPAFLKAQLEDALQHVDHVDPALAAPFSTPADTRLLTLLVAAVIAITLFPIPNHEHPLPPGFQARYAQLLDNPTISMERERLRQLRAHLDELPDEVASELYDEIEALLNAVENQAISEREFLEAIDELLETYFESDPTSDELARAEEVLADAAQRLQDEHSELLNEYEELEEAMEALQNEDFQAASAALNALAERLNSEELSPEDAEQLASLLEAFSDHLEEHQERLEDLFKEHRDAFEELREQFEGRDDLSTREKDLLNDARQQMEEAGRNRDEFEQSAANRQLDQLSRELDEAAEDLREGTENSPTEEQGTPENQNSGDPNRDDGIIGEGSEAREAGDRNNEGPGQGDQQGDPDEPDYRNEPNMRPPSDKIQEASRQLEEMERQRQQQEQRQEARRQLEELRESMARNQPQEGQDASEQRRGEQMDDFMSRARGDDEGENGQERQAQRGDGNASQNENGSDGNGEEMESGSGETSGQGSTDEDPGPTEQADALDNQESQTIREVVAADQSPEGRSRSEIIRSASEEGFATVDYEDVYADYEEVAEEVIEREEVPDGYRFYIKRYFQLIRPQQ